MRTYISAKNVLIDEKFIPASVGIENGKIVDICEYGKGEDMGDQIISPGLIDLHTHGGYGCESNDADYEQFKFWLSRLAEEATTSVLVSPYTATMQRMQAGVALADRLMKEALPISVLGCHLEGPFISKEYLGAMNGELIRKPSVEIYKEIVQEHADIVRLMTMACELEGAFELMDYLKNTSTVLSNGHSGLTYQEGLAAIEHGLKGFTHTYNGMSGLHHREVGTVGCSLLFDECYSECICDGYHVSFPALEILFRCKPKNRVVLVTDSLKTKGLPEGVYLMDGEKIEMRHGCAYTYGTNQLSGSTLSMLQNVKNIVEHCHVPLENALMAASENPATYIGVERTKGKIRVGNDADLIVLNESLDLQSTYHLGIKVYERRNCISEENNG